MRDVCYCFWDTSGKKEKVRVFARVGFLFLEISIANAVSDSTTLELGALLNWEAIQSFTQWLRNRAIAEGTVAEYCSAFITTAKFLYRNANGTGSNFERIEIVQR